MNEYTHQLGDAFASPSTPIHRTAVGSRSEEFAGRSPQRQGRHRLHRSSRRGAASFLPFRSIAVTVTAAALAAAAFAVSTHHEPASPPASAQSALFVPQLTKADVQQLEHLTPAETSRFTKDVDTAYGKLGVRVGVGTVGAPTVPGRVTQPTAPGNAIAGKATLTSYQWAGGVQWDHLWVTASYANLEPFANNSTVVAQAATQFCGKLPGWFSYGCYVVGTLVSYFLSKVHVTNWSSSHGVWGAYYWFPWRYETGGFW